MTYPKNFGSIKYSSNRLQGCVLEIDLEYPNNLCELQSNYPFALDEIEIGREILSNFQLMIGGFYEFPIGNVKKLVPNFFDKEKYVLHHGNWQLFWGHD